MKNILKWAAIVAGLVVLSILALPLLIGWEDPPEKIEAESDMMQTAMYTMMTDNKTYTVAAYDHTTGSLAVNTWTALPEGQGAVPLAPLYLRDDTTEFYFCWDASGLVFPRSDDPDVAKEPGECPQSSSRFQRSTLDHSVSSDSSSCSPMVEHLISDCH